MCLWSVLCLLLADGGPECRLQFQPTQAQQDQPRVQIARRHREQQIRHLFAAACLDYPPRQVLLRALKREQRLELWVAGKNGEFRHLKDYPVCALSGELGPKRRQGDLQVPEGFYRISWLNPNSQFWLSLKIDYPNASDRIRSDRQRPGGDIFIHGSCVTIGCLPLGDEGIEELYLIVLDSRQRFGQPVLVQIFPSRLDPSGMALLEQQYAGQPELVEFWRELQPGFLALEKKRRPVEPRVDATGRYLFEPDP